MTQKASTTATDMDDMFDMFDDEPPASTSTANNNGFDEDFAAMTENSESQETDAFSPVDKGILV